MRFARPLWLGVWLTGCAAPKPDSGNGAVTSESDATTTTEPTGDPDSGEPVDPLCVDAPVVTWDSWGQGFLGANCQSCHRTTSTNRNGAPEDVFFDDRHSALALSDRILARSTGDAPTMPPSGGISETDRYKLEVWLTCWE